MVFSSTHACNPFLLNELHVCLNHYTFERGLRKLFQRYYKLSECTCFLSFLDGVLHEQLRKAQLRGLPLAVEQICHYFVMDGEGFRWGRYYREAGYIAHSCLW